MKVILGLYLAVAAFFTGLYVVSEMFGWERPTAAYASIRPSVRAAPGSGASSSKLEINNCGSS